MSGPAEPLRYQPVIRADPQAFRQPGQGVDLGPDVAGPAAAMPRQLLAGPHLGGLRQPRLADAGERQSPALTDPGHERAGDSWDLALFGHRGRLSFTGISQPWLTPSAQVWAGAELTR